MPPTNFLRELAAAGITLTPEPRARLRLTLLGRTLTLTAYPWSAHLSRADSMTISACEPAPSEPAEPDDIIAEIEALAKNAAQTPVPLVAEGPNLHATVLSVGGPDASAWRLPCPNFAHRRTVDAWENGYADALHFLAEDVATFAAAVVAHYLSPSPQTAREVRLCGIRAAGQIVAMVKRVAL